MRPMASPRRWTDCAKSRLLQRTSSQLHVALAAVTVFLLEHRDRADFAPVVDLETAVFGDFDHPNNLNKRRMLVTTGDQFDFHVPQSVVAAKGAAAYVFQQWNEFVLGCLYRQHALTSFGNRWQAGLLLHGLSQIHDSATDRFCRKSRRIFIPKN